MELKDTIKLMESDDYKDRFKAEYYQVKIRKEKLQKMLYNKPFHSEDFYYYSQLDVMRAYMTLLEGMARKENIDLD